ncbi:MAG TPA: hypothetical protein VJ696_03515 [Rhodanobacteraceae bacterium]|nr:hypothetical protein [Rhodanobacteraceae bacterium]
MRTSLYGVLCIVVRLGVVFLAFDVLSKVVGMIASWDRYEGASMIAVVGVLVGVLLFAFLLWVYPGIIARVAAGRSSQQVFESPISPQQLQWIALSVLGMYFVVSAIIDLADVGAFWVMTRAANANPDDGGSYVFSNCVYATLRLAGGLILVLGARGLSGVLHRLRYGTATSAPE